MHKNHFQLLTIYGIAKPYKTGLRPNRSWKNPPTRLPMILPMPKTDPIQDISSTINAKVSGDSSVCKSLIVGAIHPMPTPCENVAKFTAKIIIQLTQIKINIYLILPINVASSW